jgi:hypothetical protein
VEEQTAINFIDEIADTEIRQPLMRQKSTKWKPLSMATFSIEKV